MEKMFFYLVVLLSLSWQHATGAENPHHSNGGTFDQVATASENVAQNTAKSERKEEDFRDQLIPSMVDTMMHYENSNGFVPMVASTSSKPRDIFQQTSASSFTLSSNNDNRTRSLAERKNFTYSTEKVQKIESQETTRIENDPAYSTEAKILFDLSQFGSNRRSFDFRESQNDFELLKVKNDTPAVANYPDFYDDTQNTEESEQDNATPSSSKRKNRDRGKRIEGHGYGTDSIQNNPQESPYNPYYSYNMAKDKKKSSSGQEKVLSNYRQQDAMNYDGHGRSATRQNGRTLSSLPRTNHQVTELTRSGAKTYDDSSRQRFSRPVVVAEPNNYKVNFDTQPLKNTDPNSPDYQTSRSIDSTSAETSQRFTIYNRDGRFRSYEDTRDSSADDSMDYAEYTERPRRTQKSRRRPHGVDTKRLPKEHRTPAQDSSEYENQAKRHNPLRTKSRQRVKANPWTEEDRRPGRDESYEDVRYDDRLTSSETKNTKTQSGSKFKTGTAWSQVTPNIEISHSSGIEIDQLEKSKYLVPFKVNLVPVTDFDHDTALGNSQGFDVSNAILQNLVTATPVSAVSQATAVYSTPETMIDSKNLRNLQNLAISTPLPDIVLGHNNFQNQIEAVQPQSSGQSKYSSNLRSQYVSSTIAPLFAVAQPSLQSLQLQNVQSAITPRTTYVTSPSSSSGVQHLLVPQPTLQTLSNLVQAPVQSASEYNIQVYPHGLHGQNLVNQGNIQLQGIPTVSTVTPAPQGLPVTRVSLVTAESQSKKNLLPGTSANFLASASLAVGQNEQKQSANGNSYYFQNQNNQQLVKTPMQDGLYQVVKNVNLPPKGKAYIQATHLVPALLHPLPTLATITTNPQQFLGDKQNLQSTNFVLQQPRDQNEYNAMQVQLQLQRQQLLKNVKLPGLTYQTIDNMGSHTSSNSNTIPGIAESAHLPNVGTKNVEILNPNIKPSPIDMSVVNSYQTMQYPAAVLTTPVPMFSTTGFVTARPMVSSSTAEPVNLQNFVDSLTEIGSKPHQTPVYDLKTYQSQDRPMFNPINFVPNMEVLKNQNALNSKANDPLQQNLNLVPLIPGGNFFKPSFNAQSELVVKPKLSSDLEKYAEQMFKESLKTIYNSHKWNNDRKPQASRQNISESMDLMKLRRELQRLKASLSDSKRNKDPYEGHQSENVIKSTDYNKKQEQLLSALEQMIKSHTSDSQHGYHGTKRPNRPRPSDLKHNFGPSGDFRDTKHIRDFLTPPKFAHSHRTKITHHFHEKPGRKRPGGPQRFKGQSHFNGPRSHSRPNHLVQKSVNLETSGTNIDAIHADSPRFENVPNDVMHSDYRKDSPSFDSYPSITTSMPEAIAYNTILKGHRSNGKEFDVNHPRMHNLLGLLMKNKQLPSGNMQNYFRDKDQLKQFFDNERRQLEQQFYDDALREYLLKATEGTLYSNSRPNLTGGRRVATEKVSVSK